MREEFIFSDIDQLTEFVNISQNSDIKDYQPSMRLVQSKWIKPIIGKQMLNDLIEKSKTDDFTIEERSFLHSVRFPAAILTQYHSVGSGNVTLTKGGFSVPKSEQIAPASQFRINQYKDELEVNAQAALSDLLEWLQQNGQNFPLYWDSDERKSNMGTFIKDAKVFNFFTSLDVDHFIFRNLRYLIARTEDTVIENCLCKDLYDHMRTVLQAGDDLEEYKDLISPISEVIVNFVIADAINELGISIQGSRILLKFRDSSTEDTNGMKAVSENTLDRLSKNYKNLAALAITKLKNQLDGADIGTYPIYESSECGSYSVIPEIEPYTSSSSNGIML